MRQISRYYTILKFSKVSTRTWGGRHNTISYSSMKHVFLKFTLRFETSLSYRNSAQLFWYTTDNKRSLHPCLFPVTLLKVVSASIKYTIFCLLINLLRKGGLTVACRFECVQDCQRKQDLFQILLWGKNILILGWEAFH